MAPMDGGGRDELKWVGKRPVRPDGVDKVTGRARFGADYNMPGQLTGLVLRSPHPHARIKGIDVSAAEAVPGVKAVITAADMPEMPSEPMAVGEMSVNFRDFVDFPRLRPLDSSSFEATDCSRGCQRQRALLAHTTGRTPRAGRRSHAERRTGAKRHPPLARRRAESAGNV